MSKEKNSNKSTENDSSTTEDSWETAADRADEKADAEVEQIKKDAHDQLKKSKENFHNPDD